MNTTKLKRLLAAGLPISLLMMASGTLSDVSAYGTDIDLV